MSIFKQVELILSKRGKANFTSKEIKQLMVSEYGTNPSSVIPADYCYNRTNFGIDKDGTLDNKFLIFNNNSNYSYVGFNFCYSGFVYHKPRGEHQKLTVGQWIKGKYYPLEKIQNDIEVIPTENNYTEGSTRKILVNVYERDLAARNKCLEYFGFKCWVCSFDFFDVYGDLGKGFIHVHHIIPLSEIKSEYIVNPCEDLIPLCPNCHAMVHKRNPPLHPKELKKTINR